MQQQAKRETKSHEIPVAIIGLIGTFFGALAVVVVALIGRSAGAVYISTTTAQATPSVSTVAQTESPAPAPTVTVTETVSATAPGAPPLPEGVQLRRSTGNNPISLRPGYSVDLDDATGPNWSLSQSYQDLGYQSGSPPYLNLRYSELAPVSKQPDYATCAVETRYSDEDIPREDIKKGAHFCMMTNEKRFAGLTIVAISTDEVTFKAEVWDPPLEE
jgi:hypothetical protein